MFCNVDRFNNFFFINFDGYYIVRTDQGKPRTKYIFNKCGTNIYFFFTIQRFGPSPSPNFKDNGDKDDNDDNDDTNNNNDDNDNTNNNNDDNDDTNKNNDGNYNTNNNNDDDDNTYDNN